jgi:peptidoglycan/xylan/chitin deacetylase (PgdA/CDA1 family)
MRYFQFTLRKTVALVFITMVLLGGVVATFNLKRSLYGSTPFFNSFGLLTENISLTMFFSFEHFVRSGTHALLAALPYFRSEYTAYAQEPAQAIPVLTYHRLSLFDDGSNVTIANFADQMQTLYDNGWRTITLGEYQAFMRGEKKLPPKSFLITFDDGAQQSFYPADPILKTLGYSAVEYVIVAASETPKTTYYLTPEQLRAMLKTGRWELGSHSYDAHHQYLVDAKGDTGIFYSDLLWLPQFNRSETVQEFTQRVHNDLILAKEDLEKTYGVPITTFAFPFGGEIGEQAAKNFPQGESITIAEAAKVYSIGWIQNQGQTFTANYPAYATFLNKRIHVDHDWSGEKLLRVMENSLPKELPWSDDMSVDRGWLTSWGEIKIGGFLSLAAIPSETSAETILDGSLLWQNYEFDAQVSWRAGDARLLAQLTDSKTYRSCVFSNGRVSIQDTVNGDTRSLIEVKNPVIQPGSSVLGIKATQRGITCLYNGVQVASAELGERNGGIGIQTWNETTGTAALSVTSASVNPL